ncbi:MAG: DNA topoisomerase (ATP-hydrolyzing) [Acidimicrobiales bacterium]
MATNDGLFPFAREVIDVPVADELGESFLAYSLSVITSRAIPDVRDGLKPVQRRILYSMYRMRLLPENSHRKCAHVTGDVMGKFHPHGDAAIYDALVRLGQDFAKPVMLIDPQGNFGTLDDPPAAQRYTECKLTPAAIDLVAEIDEETVEFRATYDGETQEPAYLPGLLPNLLVNGTSGIAVGMATNMPTHNLVEVYEAIKLVMTKRRPKPTIDELMAVLPGPDFPTGGIAIDDDLRTIYETGRGSIRMRATAEIVDITRARQGLVFTELPYLVGIERVISKVKELVNAGKLNGVADVKNLSDRKSGMRLVIEAKAGIKPELLLEQLYKLTPLEESFGVNNVVLVDGTPTTVGLYDLCQHYIDHRLDVVVKRSEFRLRKATERLHIIEGLLIAIDNIDLVVSIIRTSANSGEARERLMDQLTLSYEQAEWILELRLRRLTALAYDELVTEKNELVTTIAELEKILGSEQRQRTIVLKELGEVAERYGTPRRTRIIGAHDVPDLEALVEAVVADIEDDPCVVTLSASGLIGREPIGTSKSFTPSRHDVLAASLTTSLRSPVLAVTSNGRVLSIIANDLPEVGGRSRGRDANEVFSADRNETIVGLLPGIAQGEAVDPPVLFVTALGKAKRIELPAIIEVTSGRLVMKLDEKDRIIAVLSAPNDADIVMTTTDAQALRTTVDSVSIQGPAARGVAAMSLKGNAKILAAGLATDDTVIISITDTGTAKSTSVEEIPVKGRGTGGVRLTKFKDEQRLDYAWIGVPDRIVAIVGQTDAPTKPDNSPESFAMRPTRRDGFSTTTPRRILHIGSLRW